MKSIIASGLLLGALHGAVLPASAAVNPVVEVLFYPLVKLAEFQSSLSPEKDSCWNKGRRNVVGCRVADRVLEGRPTPYAE